MAKSLDQMAEPERLPRNPRGILTDTARTPAREACEFGDRKSSLTSDEENKLFRPPEQ